jgi:hypothetical protein
MGGAVSTILALRLRRRGYDIAQVSNPHPPHMQSLKPIKHSSLFCEHGLLIYLPIVALMNPAHWHLSPIS